MSHSVLELRLAERGSVGEGTTFPPCRLRISIGGFGPQKKRKTAESGPMTMLTHVPAGDPPRRSLCVVGRRRLGTLELL